MAAFLFVILVAAFYGFGGGIAGIFANSMFMQGDYNVAGYGGAAGGVSVFLFNMLLNVIRETDD